MSQKIQLRLNSAQVLSLISGSKLKLHRGGIDVALEAEEFAEEDVDNIKLMVKRLAREIEDIDLDESDGEDDDDEDDFEDGDEDDDIEYEDEDEDEDLDSEEEEKEQE